ncbi:MAG: DUF3291 domain-containing protein [Pseudomonadota bacterium]
MALIQFNVALAKWPLDDPRIAEFTNNSKRMKAIAQRSDGFLWQLPDAGQQVLGDPLMTWTLSMWDSADALAKFAFNTVHRQLFAKRETWFPVLEHPAIVMWEGPEDPRPTLEDAQRRLMKLHREGSSDEAFGWERFEALRARRDAVA